MLHAWSDDAIAAEAADLLALLLPAVHGLVLEAGGIANTIDQIRWSRAETPNALIADGPHLRAPLEIGALGHVRVRSGDRRALWTAMRDVAQMALLHPRLEALVACPDGTAIVVLQEQETFSAAFRAGEDAARLFPAPKWAQHLGKALPHDGTLVSDTLPTNAHSRLAAAASLDALPKTLRVQVEQALERGASGNRLFYPSSPKHLLALRSGPFRLLWQPGCEDPAVAFHGILPD